MANLTQKEVAAHLGLSARRARDVLSALGVDHRSHSLDQIRIAYIEDLREKAAGRNDEDLGEARRLDTMASAHLKTIDIFEKHKKVVWAEHVGPLVDALIDAIQSNVMTAATKIVSGLESQYDIQIDDELITSSLRAALRNVEGSGKELVTSVFGEPEETGA